MKYVKEFYRFIKHILENKQLLGTLIKNDFKKQYLGSYLGIVWVYIQPLVFMSVIWFVFEKGFRSAPVHGNIPFSLWLISGMIPWFFISDALISGTNSVVSNAFLVKKVSFRVSILPIVKIGSSLLIHMGLIVFIVFMFLIYGFKPSIYWLQLPFFILCSIILVLGLSWLTSSIMVFVKDIASVISVILQIGFWATPIFWNIALIPDKYQYLFKLNPAYYVVEGYRDTFINHIWFWERPLLTMQFLSITAIFFIFGAIVFKRLRPHFGDVL